MQNPLKIFIPCETHPGETRVSATPETIKSLSKKISAEFIVEKDAGIHAQISDKNYEKSGAKMVENFATGASQADIIIGINPIKNLENIQPNTHVITTLIPTTDQEALEGLQKKKVVGFSLNMVPRITRAQKMDVLSSQSNLAGYKAVLLAANKLGKIFPLMMTAAGTLNPTKVVIMGAGVAGLQAIATAKRLGAQVESSDIRLAAKEQVESVGGKFIYVEGMEDLEDENGYALPPTKEFLERQAKVMEEKVAGADIVITTALIPGRPAPKLISGKMVQSMKPGSVIVDMAALMGGNCVMTKKGQTITTENGIQIIGEENIPALLPIHATDLFAKNIQNFLEELIIDHKIDITDKNKDNQVIQDCLLTQDGKLVNEKVKNMLSK
jgi:NAD(P) transhydrogenase subunit alpha